MNKEKLQKLLAKKRNLPEAEKKAKMDVVKGLSDDMADHMHRRMGGLKKVEVASDSKEGLKAGLDLAKQVASRESHGFSDGGEAEQSYQPSDHDQMKEPEEEGKKYMDADTEGTRAEEASESAEEEASEHEDNFQGLDVNQIDDKIQKLLELKKQLEHSK